ncbi:Probable DNA topoisomerase II, putative [Brugia malayi]|uniref:DNA topoisomerase 2 n=1 Tax=Brugia malayi TaxID=6279 RepID=A0A0J9XU95_BRUMA|nr:putative DNA topoisomerase II, putative [Brugia malayi]CDP95544.1 Bm5019, isoform a [Brugia malayi]VIO94552.1 Probable DNA topoisomerase II, putative [Brugia malayi]
MSSDEESDYDPSFDSSVQKKKTAKKQTDKKDKLPVKKKQVSKKETNGNSVINGDKSDDGDPLDIFTNIDQQPKGLSIEKIYQKKSQLEHILLRPDTYIGSVERTDKAPLWVYDMETERIIQRDISYVPGLYKIFDEILVNAADNKQRDSKMNLIKININKETNEISVFNNGKGIPVVLHKVEQLYVPELIFGTLLTSSNYDDSERKVTGGRNGYGAKLCNIFSREFTVETSSKEYGKAFKQTWKNNMTKDKDPFVSKSSGEDFTRVTFKPDLAKFRMTELDDDIISLISRRAYDVAGSTKGVKVYLNGKLLPVQGFKQYVDQYAKHNLDNDGEPYKVVYEQVNERWEVALTVSEKGFQQVSFVNSIATTKGGRHVDYVADQITAKLIDTIKKKVGKSGVNVKPFQIKSHMWIFVNSLVENPTFDSQTKETMTLQAKSFGSKCELSERFINAVMKCGIVEAVLAWVRFKQQETLDKKCSSKKTSKLKGIPKLEDANDAGTKNSSLCTLILTEGDSAKSLAVSGLGVVGRDRYGVFPLRGKMLNVREGSHKQIMENAEINSLIKIIGLQYRLKYDKDEDMRTLRYGKIMVMADQDQDGSHIKGLVINFIHYNWPVLIRRNFVEEFITPIVKATKGKESLSFFSLPEYAEWRNNTENWKTYRIKYYKGLGTSTSKEAKEYFTDMIRHRIRFQYSGEEDDSSLDMAFSKKKIEDRKVWLTNWMAEKKTRREQGLTEEYLYDKDTRAVSFKDFVNKELVLFSNADNERSIPSLVDGLKPGQRKVLFTCFKRADKKEVKVAQLAGAVGEMSAYHHGEASLMSTIVNLAQDYVGSNNINLLLPIGQFGTRLQGGKDSASPRYIFTQLNPVTRALFPAVDENVLRFLFEENQRIEPEWYCPIIPTVLVNGAEGIGTAWSTKIPNYNPREIVDNMRRLIRGEEPKPLIPWFKNFRGTIEKLDESRYICSGEIALLGDDTIEITELPIRTWTQNYKESVLESMLEGSDKQPPLIQDFKEYHTDTTVKFVVKMNPAKLREAKMEGLHKIFKLQTAINISSMVLFDPLGCLRRFSNVEEICKEFFEIRKKKYIERKAFQEGMLRAQSERLSNQARFILEKIKGEILIENKRKAVIVEQLVKKGFDPDPVKKWKELQRKRELEMTGEFQVDDEEMEGEEEEESESSVSPMKKDLEKKLSDYDYLVGMAILKLSEEEKDKLLHDSELKLEELKALELKTWSDLWEEDLNNFLVELEKQEAKERADIELQVKDAVKKIAGVAMKGGRKKAGTLVQEVLPDPNGIRVHPSLDAIKEKYEGKKTDEQKVRKPRISKEPKQIKDENDEGGEKNKGKPKRQRKENDRDGNSMNAKAKKGKRNKWESDSSEDDFDESDYVIDDDDDDVIEIKKTTAGDRKRRAEQSITKMDLTSDDTNVEGSLMQSGSGEDKKKFHEKMDDLFLNEKPSGSNTKSRDIAEIKEAKSKKQTKPKAKITKENKKGSESRKRKVKSNDDDDEGSDGGADVPFEPAAVRPRERGRQLKAVKYTFDDDNDDDSDDIPGLSESTSSSHQMKRRKKIESDEEFELSN